MSTLRILDLEQRSPEWYEARCGIVTASAMSGLISVGAPDALSVECPTCNAKPDLPCLAANRKEPTAIKTPHDARAAEASNLPPVIAPANNETSRGLIAALASERIANYVEETWPTSDMQRGINAEPFARDLYAEHIAKDTVDEVGFMIRQFDGFSIGYSPDGLVGEDGLIEIKAPRQKGHVITVISDEGVPAQHMAQLQTGLLVTGRKWIDFVSYNGGLHLWPKRVTPDQRWQDAILAAAKQAEDDIAAIVTAYKEAVVGLPVAPRIDFNEIGLVF